MFCFFKISFVFLLLFPCYIPLQVSNDFPHTFLHILPKFLFLYFQCLFFSSLLPSAWLLGPNHSTHELTNSSHLLQFLPLQPSFVSLCVLSLLILFSPPLFSSPVLFSLAMSVSVRNPPQRRRSLGPVSPKRIYRNLSVRLRGGEASVSGETDTLKHLGKSADAVRYLDFILRGGLFVDSEII